MDLDNSKMDYNVLLSMNLIMIGCRLIVASLDLDDVVAQEVSLHLFWAGSVIFQSTGHRTHPLILFFLLIICVSM